MGQGGKIFFRILLILSVILTGLLLLSRNYPETVTTVYTRGIFPVITAPLRYATTLWPFSIGEMLLIILIFSLIVGGIRRIVACIRLCSVKPFLVGMRRLSAFLLVGIICFILLGGFNYNGQTFAEQAGYTLSEASARELEALCRILAQKAAKVRNQLPQNEEGVTESPLTMFEILKKAQDGYDILAEKYPWLGGDYGTPKPALLSHAMSYLQISGIYPYLVPEAIVNSDTPVMSLPHTVCHEMAHQRGIAREDEANFVAYLASISNPEPIFQYSGYLEAFICSMNALYETDIARWKSVLAVSHSGILRDMAYIDGVWASYTTPGDVVGQVSQTVNDLYLKGNAIEDGVQSYGRMVDLLLAEWRRLEQLH